MKLKERFTIHPRAKAPRSRKVGTTLDDCYGRYSEEKRDVYKYCMDLKNELNGTNFGISSYNAYMFTVMFDFEHPETGEPMRAHITPSNNHAYYL